MSRRQPVIADFETFYSKDLSVRIQGLRNYSARADAYIVGLITPEWEFCGTIAELEREHGLAWVADPDIQFWAANSNFDQRFWNKYCPPAAHDWECILDRAAFHQLPRGLADVSRVVLGEVIDKSVRDEMRGVRFEDLDEAGKLRVINYCLEDCRKTKKLVETLPEPSATEQRLAAHTRMINRRGLRVNTERIIRDIGFLQQMRYDAMQKIPWVEADEAPLSHIQFSLFCEAHGVAAPKSLNKTDPECNQWMRNNPHLARVIDSMRLFRGMNSKLEKLKSILENADADGIIPLDLLYLGARHTRRWSSVNINVQNLDAGRVFVEEMSALGYFQSHPDEQPGIFLREYFLPPPGCKFGIIDYSQIEPRCLNWLVGNEVMLDAIRAGYGIYEAHAKATMGWNGPPGTLKKTDPDRYKFAKIRVLALGYGMGWKKFQDTAALPPPKGLGVVLTDAQAQTEVTSFRTSNPKIVGMWRGFDQLVKAAALDKERTLEIEMPTGDKLKHFSVRGKGRGMGFESFTIRGDRSQMSHQPSLWGGTLTENVTQRMARDILGEAILRLEDAGFPVAFHAHDEIVLVLDEATVETDFEEAKRLMAAPPEWCQDLPIGVDGDVCATYTKLN